jgi:hypothetical protein
VNQLASANAGNDTTCAYELTQVPLNGIAANYATVQWTTSGTGTFSAAASLTGYYYPSSADKTAVNVTLTLTASAVSPCTIAASDSRIIHFDFPTAIQETKSESVGMVISPNPSHGLFKILVSGTHNENISVTISDITGRTIVQRSLGASEIGHEQFDLAGHPRGLYLVRIQTGSESMVRKLVIE